ncbi:MAG: hypothetical protein MZV49_15655 [Rhodopseudomonas palustris]|nr:hypothetical protein [Rhodopseudomonas palustris]
MERANLDFANLPFAYQKTDANIRYWFRNGKWSAGELTADEYIPLHMAATCLHYGQEVFEGLKAYERPDGRVQTFRMMENARRIQRSARKLFMQSVPDEIFMTRSSGSSAPIAGSCRPTAAGPPSTSARSCSA